MKGTETKLIAFLEGSSNRYVIPVYQRNYDWKIENCRQMFDDLVRLIRENRKSHFFGSIVSVYNPDGKKKEFQIIDGQQRLTTTTLLLTAMRNLLLSGRIASNSPNLSQQLYEEYLVDKWEQGDTRIKLKPIQKDQQALENLVESVDEPIADSNLTINYKYFHDRIQNREITVDELYDAICRLEIISITLGPEDNPQLIFESLNSTGLDLSEGDKVRNYMLMGLPSKKQTMYYETYWRPIEQRTGSNLSAFLRDFLSSQQRSTPAMDKVYAAFKSFASGFLDSQALFALMLDYAKWYEVLLGRRSIHPALDACIVRLNRLETTVTRPFFLEVLRLLDEGKLAADEATSIFLTTESYLFRRMMSEVPTNALNKVFLLLHNEIVRFDGTEANYWDKFIYAITSKRESGRFPDNEEFLEAFGSRRVYEMQAKNRLYLLERLENEGTVETKDVYGHIDNGTYSIEHIMPQQLTAAWKQSLGEDHERIHDTWLHRMANLTLTAYNSRYSNSTFEEKKNNSQRLSGQRYPHEPTRCTVRAMGRARNDPAQP